MNDYVKVVIAGAGSAALLVLIPALYDLYTTHRRSSTR